MAMVKSDRALEIYDCGCHRWGDDSIGYCSSHAFEEYISAVRRSGRTVIESSE